MVTRFEDTDELTEGAAENDEEIDDKLGEHAKGIVNGLNDLMEGISDDAFEAKEDQKDQ